MAGKGGARPGSGRKCHLADKTVETVLRLSAANIIRAFRSKEIDLQFKAELGKHFVVKKIPTIVESDGSFAPKTIVLIRNEKALEQEKNRVENQINA